MSQMLSAKQILEADDSQMERVDIPEWGGHAFMKPLSGMQRDRFEMMVMNWKEKNKEFSNIRALLVGWTLCDENGNRIFSTAREIQALGEKNAKVLDRLYDKARELSGLREEDVEELEENF